MTPEKLRELEEIDMHHITRLLPHLESGEREIIPGKKISIATYGKMSHLPDAKLRPPKKYISISIREALNQLTWDIQAIITIDQEPRVLSIILRMGRSSLTLYDEQKYLLNADIILQLESDLKRFIQQKEEVTPAVRRIHERVRTALTDAETAADNFERKTAKRKK